MVAGRTAMHGSPYARHPSEAPSLTERLAPGRRRAAHRPDSAPGPVRDRPARPRRRANPADHRRRGSRGGHDQPGHPVGRQEHLRPRRARAGRGDHRCRRTARQPHRAARGRPRGVRWRRRGHGGDPAHRPGAEAPWRAGHLDRRRALARVGDHRGGAGSRRRGASLHRRRQLRTARLRDRGAQGRARGGRDRRGVRGRPGADDARRLAS